MKAHKSIAVLSLAGGVAGTERRKSAQRPAYVDDVINLERAADLRIGRNGLGNVQVAYLSSMANEVRNNDSRKGLQRRDILGRNSEAVADVVQDSE